MKSFLISSIATLFLISAQGQLTKKNWLIGGSGNLYTYNEDYTTPSTTITGKYTSIDLSASVGYFFLNKFSAGIRPYFSSFKGKSSGGGQTNYYRFAIGPFARYYFLNEQKQFNLLADVGYQLGINKDMGGMAQKGKFNIFSIMAGIEIFFNSTAGIEILVGYSEKATSIENSNDEFNNEQRGFQTSIGFTLHLEKD